MAASVVTPVGGKDSDDVRTARRWQYLLILFKRPASTRSRYLRAWACTRS